MVCVADNAPSFAQVGYSRYNDTECNICQDATNKITVNPSQSTKMFARGPSDLFFL